MMPPVLLVARSITVAAKDPCCCSIQPDMNFDVMLSFHPQDEIAAVRKPKWTDRR